MHNKERLIKELNSTHEKIIHLIESLSESELTIPYHPGVNPPVWELGHASFFYEEFLFKDEISYDPSMDDIWDSFNIDHKDRWAKNVFPCREETLRYVKVIQKKVLDRIEKIPLTLNDLYLYQYVIYHHNMHIESLIWARQTSAYARPQFNSLDNKEISETAFSNNLSDEISSLGDATVPAGKHLIGMPADKNKFTSENFAFDNEKPCFEVDLKTFNISKTLVSNQEFLAFVDAQGYQNTSYWSFGGKQWLKKNQPKHPLYWKYEKDQWLEKTFDTWKPLISNYPVKHINYWEVEAYCHWAQRRLPTEYEWEVAALANRKNKSIKRFPWGNEMDVTKVDMNALHMAEIPVTAYSEGDSSFGCRQMIGTVWEWTSSQYLPYDGFTMDMYAYMSTLQFGYHKTTKGGSCASSSNLIRGSYRQAYFPDRRDVFIGFRTCAI